MLKYNNLLFKSRKALKDYIGGTNRYNKLIKENKIQFINDIAINNFQRTEKDSN